tara:strand:- start:1164 stop:2225 length:1062 start_codon:yes stop_codon:yes gene_type:complete
MHDDSPLTEGQRKRARELCKTEDLLSITRDIFANPSLDGRSKEGRIIREFLNSEGLEYKTTKYKNNDSPVTRLTEQHKQFIDAHFDELTAIQISKTLFGSEITPLHGGARLVRDYCTTLLANKRKVDDRAYAVHSYDPPGTIKQMCEKINSNATVHLNPAKLSAREKMGVEYLIQIMSTPRFVTTIRRFIDLEDRSVFESQFIIHVWDKPDLTSEEVALYTNLCQDYVLQIKTAKHLEKLSKMFELQSDDERTSISMAQTIREKNEEFDKIAKRIQSLIDKLNGKRVDRIKNQQNRNISILPLIQEFQEEEGRQRMIMIAEMQREVASEEADRLEDLSDLKARLLGINKRDAI